MMSSPRVGVDMLYYAILTQDDGDGTAYDSPVRVYNVTNIGVNFNTQFATFFADDGPREATSQVGEIDVNISTGDLDSETLSTLIGADLDGSSGVVDYKTTAFAPKVAIGFRAQKSDGSYRYVWLMKGRFGVPDDEYQTKEGSINYQPQSITGKFMARVNDDLVFRRVDSGDTAMSLPDEWFAGPDLVPGGTEMTVSATEADGVVTWTFSEDVSTSYANDSYFRLYEEGVGYVDDLTITVPTTTTVDVTAAGLSGDYIAIVEKGVRSTTGDYLAERAYFSFTVT